MILLYNKNTNTARLKRAWRAILVPFWRVGFCGLLQTTIWYKKERTVPYVYLGDHGSWSAVWRTKQQCPAEHPLAQFLCCWLLEEFAGARSRNGFLQSTPRAVHYYTAREVHVSCSSLSDAICCAFFLKRIGLKSKRNSLDLTMLPGKYIFLKYTFLKYMFLNTCLSAGQIWGIMVGNHKVWCLK